jgi:hypothetical protein
VRKSRLRRGTRHRLIGGAFSFISDNAPSEILYATVADGVTLQVYLNQEGTESATLHPQHPPLPYAPSLAARD